MPPQTAASASMGTTAGGSVAGLVLAAGFSLAASFSNMPA